MNYSKLPTATVSKSLTRSALKMENGGPMVMEEEVVAEVEVEVEEFELGHLMNKHILLIMVAGLAAVVARVVVEERKGLLDSVEAVFSVCSW